MADKSGIEWTDATWNPVTGCTKVSSGCKHCYAEREWPRMTRLVPSYAGRDFTDVRTHADRLDQPMRWKRPRRIFVNSMSDLFHEDVPNEFLPEVFAVMAAAPRHVFQVLTKRPERMREALNDPIFFEAVACIAFQVHRFEITADDWPLPNVWIGVSVEDQAAADERIPLLLGTPAAVRWISVEPLLGPVDLMNCEHPNYSIPADYLSGQDSRSGNDQGTVDWVVVGGESGPKARPMHPDWVRLLRDQCAASSVPFLFKQWGEYLSAELDECPCGPPDSDWMWADGSPWDKFDGQRGMALFRRVGKKRAGRLLDDV